MPHLKITDDVYLVGGLLLTNTNDCAVYVVLGEKPVLIDCGCGEGYENLKRNLAEVGVDVGDIACVIGTHGHYDHIHGIARLREDNPDIMLAMHENDAAPIEDADPERTCAGWFFGVDIEPQRVDKLLAGGDTLEIGGNSFEIIHTPGHTPGSMSILTEISGKRYLFIGDSTVPGCGRVLSDYDDWRNTLENYLAVDHDYILPGHAMHWLTDPFTSSLANPLSKIMGRATYNFYLNRLHRPIWKFSILNYEYVMPFMARLGGMVKR